MPAIRNQKSLEQYDVKFSIVIPEWFHWESIAFYLWIPARPSAARNDSLALNIITLQNCR